MDSVGSFVVHAQEQLQLVACEFKRAAMECPVCKEWRPRKTWSFVQWNANGGKGSPIAIGGDGWPRN